MDDHDERIDEDQFLDLDAIRQHLIARGIPLERWTYKTLDDGSVQLSCMRPDMKFVDVIFHIRRDLTILASTPRGQTKLTLDEIECVSFDDFLQKIQAEYNKLPSRCQGDGWNHWHARKCPGFGSEEEDFDGNFTQCESCLHLCLFMEQYGERMLDNFWVRDSTGQGVIAPEGMPDNNCRPM